MSDKINALTVVLTEDVGENGAERLTTAILCFSGVLSVTPHVADLTAHLAEERARRKLAEQLWEILFPLT